jgi:hypothetical protein
MKIVETEKVKICFARCYFDTIDGNHTKKIVQAKKRPIYYILFLPMPFIEFGKQGIITYKKNSKN